MAGVELGARYRAGRELVSITFSDGTVTQLAPFSSIRFEQQPRRIEGRLVRVRRGHLIHEAPQRGPQEVKW